MNKAMIYLDDVFRKTANGGYFDFARCQRPDGTIYGSPGRCKKGTEIGAKEEAPSRKSRAVALSRNEKIAIKVMADKSLRSDKKRMAEMVRLGVPADSDFIGLVANAKKKIGLRPEQTIRDSVAAKPDGKMRLTAKIKAMSASDLRKVSEDPRLSDKQREKLNDLIAVKEAQEKIQARLKRQEERAELRSEQRQGANALAFDPLYQGKTLETLTTLRRSYETMKSMMKDPFFQTPANKARIINTRLAIWRQEKALRKSTAPKIDPATYAKTLKESPKYDKTPGSTKPISKPKPQNAYKLQSQLIMLSKKLDKKGLTKEEALGISNEILETNRRLIAAQGGRSLAPSLKEIYKEQNFNAKPELVGTASELRSRKDLRTNPDGTNIIAYRGVTTQEFADQFKGLGANGGEHFAGRGIYGNGSYAAAAVSNNTKLTEAEAKSTARAYAGLKEGLASKVTAFGFRKDANVVTFEGTDLERRIKYDNWYYSVLKEANTKTGYEFKDVGEAAAALGIHAYQVPQTREDFFVVLNRGAIVAAMDSQISDEK